MTDEQTCPMTGERHLWPEWKSGEAHLWGDWERVVEQDESTPGYRYTGDRARECRVCGRWDIEWAEVC